MSILALFQDAELSMLKCLGAAAARLAEFAVEIRHQFGGRLVVDGPERGKRAPGSGLQGHAGQSERGAIVSGGRLLRGHLGRAGHFGHLTVDHKGKLDICNCPGSIEDAIGNYTIRERSGGRFGSTRDLLAALETGDPHAGEVWSASIRALGAAVASLVNVLDPEVVLIGGGIAEADHLLLEPLQQALDEFEWRPDNHRVTIRKAELGEWAGTWGAAWNAVKSDETA